MPLKPLGEDLMKKKNYGNPYICRLHPESGKAKAVKIPPIFISFMYLYCHAFVQYNQTFQVISSTVFVFLSLLNFNCGNYVINCSEYEFN